VPFLVSFLLVAIAIWIRLQLQETPIFQEIRAKGQMTRNPWKEAFMSSNIKLVLIASIVVIGEGVVWYSGQFWALYYLQQVSKIPALDSAWIVGIALLLASPTLIFYGWLSDLIGRKPVILGGFLLAALTYYPLYSWLGTVTQPGNINYPIAIFIIFILVSTWGWCTGRSVRSWRNTSPPASATRRCRCRITSATAGAAGWCRSSPPRFARRPAACSMHCSIRSWCRLDASSSRCG